MSRKTTIKGYQAQGVKVPFAAWILDRWYTYVLLLAVPLLVMATILAAGWRDFNVMAAPIEEDSEYQNIEARDFLGKRFAQDLVSSHPSGIDEDNWTAEDEPREPSVLFSAEECADLGTAPETLLTTYGGTGEDLTATVRIYGAGQARDYYDRMVSHLEVCDSVESANTTTTDTDPELALFTFNDNRAIFTAGDAIVELHANGDSVSIDEAVEFYSEYAVESLQRSEWQCYDLTPSSSDADRSFFYDFANYTGLYETETLTNETNIENLPQPVLTDEGNDNAEAAINTVTAPDKSAPESPLPDDFNEVPDEPQRPELPLEFERVDEFSEEAQYEVSDFTGPGCGWEWSAQISPIYDEETLDHNREVTETEVQNELEREAGQYVDEGFQNSLSVLLQEPVVTRWNEHVSTVDSIHADWDWLEEQRDELRPDWDTYLADHQEWSEFPDEQEEAQEEHDAAIEEWEDATERYEDELEQCLDQREAIEDWEDQYGEDVRSGDAVIEGEDNTAEEYDEEEEEMVEIELPEVPEPPEEECTTLPTAPSEPDAPSILDEERGSEPQPPSAPEGVTVPDSWDDPAND